jgi:hypothetical protein
MMKKLVLVSGRLAFAIWLLLIAFLAVGSLIAHPSPFVMMAFAVGGFPSWVVVRSEFSRALIALMIGCVVAALPVLLLLDYGASEGGIGRSDVAPACATLGVIATILAWIGMQLGRLVWLPLK